MEWLSRVSYCLSKELPHTLVREPNLSGSVANQRIQEVPGRKTHVGAVKVLLALSSCVAFGSSHGGAVETRCPLEGLGPGLGPLVSRGVSRLSNEGFMNSKGGRQLLVADAFRTLTWVCRRWGMARSAWRFSRRLKSRDVRPWLQRWSMRMMPLGRDWTGLCMVLWFGIV